MPVLITQYATTIGEVIYDRDIDQSLVTGPVKLEHPQHKLQKYFIFSPISSESSIEKNIIKKFQNPIGRRILICINPRWPPPDLWITICLYNITIFQQIKLGTVEC